MLAIYAVLGAALSFGIGRTPGTLSFDFAELALPAVALAMFVVLYSLYDVMAVGAVKIEKKAFDTKKTDQVDEAVHLAERAQ